MPNQSDARNNLLMRISTLGSEALSLRDRFADVELKRLMNNIVTDLGIFDRMLPDRDDLLAMVVDQKEREIETMRDLLAAYPPNGPKLYPS
jgi:hypothetical protein